MQLSRALIAAALIARGAVAAADPDAPDPPSTGSIEGGVYGDTDRTTVYRMLGLFSSQYGNWALDGRTSIDVVSSASLDVRSSPQIDVTTGASGRASTIEMSDQRYEGVLGGTWNDSHGHTTTFSGSAAHERDYDSVSGDWNGAIDVLDRTTTLLGGVSVTDNRVSSVLDSTLHGKMVATGWSAGVARVLTPDDALRARYDGRGASGDQASPYRFVRFGDWTTTTSAQGQLLFANTIGSAGGLAEHVPQSRLSHALVVEWVHALGDHVGLHPQVRAAHDSWGVDSLTASIDLRVTSDAFRFQLGYRYYLQSRASFFEDKYVLAPSMYTYYTSDKELGAQDGHLVHVGAAFVLSDPQGPDDTRVLLDLHADVFRYAYPGFTLLPSRTSAFVALGLTWEL